MLGPLRLRRWKRHQALLAALAQDEPRFGGTGTLTSQPLCARCGRAGFAVGS
jgi:hypothetical protein